MTVPPTGPSPALQSALEHYERAQFSRAESICNQILAVEGRNADALHILGLISHRHGRADAAVAFMRQAVECAPGRPDLHRNLGLALRGAGRIEDSVAHYQRAAQLSTGDSNAQRELRAALGHAVQVGAERQRQGHLRGAQRIYQSVLDADPDHSDALHLLGLVRSQTGDDVAALELIGRAIQLRPKVSFYHANQALLYERAGRQADALRHYEQAWRLNPDSPDARAEFAAALKRAGRQYEAIVAWEGAWAEHPDNDALYMALWGAYQELFLEHLPAQPPVDSYIGAVARANSARRDGETDAAERLYREALALRPAAPFARSQLACLLAAGSRYREADECFRLLAQSFRYPNEVIRLDPAFVDALADGRGDPRYPQLQGAPGKTDKSLVVFIAGDTRYFRMFAYGLINSIVRNSRLDCLIHVHVVNPDEFIAGEIQFMRDELGCPDLAYTFERAEFPEGQEEERRDGTYSVRTYFACSRFLQAPRLLEHYARPLLMLDMDVLVVKDLRAALGAAGSSDVGIVHLPPNKQRVWDQIYATLVYVRPTARARIFFARLADYVWHYLIGGRFFWGLDQIAWYSVAAATAERPDALRIHPYSARMVQGRPFFSKQQAAPEYGEDACIWTITASVARNQDKLELPEYRRYLPRIKFVYGWFVPGADRVVERVLKDAPAHNGRRLWEADLQRACFERLQQGRRALDIGAHIGMWSWVLAEHFDRVDAFEPHPVLQECWRRNVARANVVLHGVALGNEGKRMRLEFDTYNTGMTHLVERGEGDDTEVRCLDDFGLDDVDFIKLDAEGYEYFILQGGARTLARNKPLVLLEQTFWNERYGVGSEAAIRYLEGLGARVLLQFGDSNYLMGW